MQRISITVDESLAQAFDELIAKRGYQNRSEAFRDLLKKELAQEALVNPSQECVAVVSYTYDHRKALLSKRNVDHQHEHLDMVISSMHVHATHDTCVEAVIAKGPYDKLKVFCENTIAEKEWAAERSTICRSTSISKAKNRWRNKCQYSSERAKLKEP